MSKDAEAIAWFERQIKRQKHWDEKIALQKLIDACNLANKKHGAI